jgi:hypothetical protein
MPAAVGTEWFHCSPLLICCRFIPYNQRLLIFSNPASIFLANT